MRKFILLVVVTIMLATPALATGSCKLTGNGRKTVCVCRVGNHWHGAPKSMCR